jgi:hypothetical protein
MRLRSAACFVGLLAAAPAQPPTEESCCAETVSAPLAPLPESATDKERWLRRIHEECADDERNVYLCARYVDAWRERLRAEAAGAPLHERFGARWQLAQACVRIGALDEAVDLCQQCLQLVAANRSAATGWLPDVLFRLAATHFRAAEKENCIARHNAESCIFPLSPRAVHLEKRGAEAARDVLVRLLETPAAETGGNDLRLEATWLLNIAHMALGSWPDGVPKRWRIPAARLAPEAAAPRFVERGGELGLARHSRAGSIALDDFTGDGRLDVLACSFDTDRPLRLCRNDGDGRFTDVTDAAGLALQTGGAHLVQGDVDGDGRLDVLVLRGGGLLLGAQFPNSLLRQDAPGHFVDVTAAAGLEVAAPTRAAAMADVDRDGDLDVFIGYETERAADGTLRFPHRLFLNDGRGKFTDGTAAAGIGGQGRCVAATFGDVDGDGDPDLFLSHFLAANQLYVNRGDGTFIDEAAARGVAAPEASGPAGFFDFDDDGDLDLFVAYYHHYRQVRSVAAYYLEGRVEDDSQRLFENDGKGRFRDVTAARGLARVLVATGLNFGDADNDGRQDLYVATGGHDMAALFPNVLLLNGDRFRDATFAAGVGHLQKGNGVAFGDLDDDGDLDLACQVGGWYQDDAFGDVMFENPGAGGRWLAVDLRGTRDNRFGVGARVRARVATPDGERDVFRTVGPGASLGCNPLRLHFGLGDAERVLFLEVDWPAEGKTQRIDGVPLDAQVTVHQDRAECERTPRAPLRLGGAR